MIAVEVREVTTYLDQIFSPVDLRKLSEDHLVELCVEIRDRIIDVVSNNGGHLASSLGVVELTVALHYVFHSPFEPIVWDVGDQAYAHKLLTGRKDRFSTLRQPGGISGFTRRDESEHDVFGAGHASTSISAALGMAEAKRLKGEKGKVVAVIGDGGMTGGLAFEALNHAGCLDRDLVVVLNDNGMFISPRVGAMSAWLSEKLAGRTFNHVKRRIKDVLTTFPRYGEEALSLLRGMLVGAKALLTPGILFEGFNFQYVGPVDGHDLHALVSMLQNVRSLDGPVLVHVRTVKGRGLPCAEKDPRRFHGVSPFCVETGKPKEIEMLPSYTAVFSKAIVDLAQKDSRIVAITAAMPDGTGLASFAQRFPERFFDVGIAEAHAVTFAAGLACGGLRPVVAIYSSFLQRSYDMIMHDVTLQNLPVTFVLDRAGLVGEDGPTHHGVFDLSYLASLPGMTIMAPSDENELARMLLTAVNLPGPAAMRFPRGGGRGLKVDAELRPLPWGKGRMVRTPRVNPKLAILSIGTLLHAALQAAERLEGEDLPVAVADLRFAKPLDEDLIVRLARQCGRILTLEENALCGGVGQAICACLQAHGILVPVINLGIPDRYIPQGTQEGLRAELGLDADGIVRAALRFMAQEASKKTA